MGVEAEVLRYAWARLGADPVLVARSDAGVCFVGLDASSSSADLRAWADRRAPGARLVEDAGALARAVEQLEAYGRGERAGFELPLDLRGTPFQIEVWRALLEIPFGRTGTYGELAARLGRPGASRAVGAAAGANPVPVIVPCHRLLAASTLGGFSAGLERKRHLLRHEGAPVERGLFDARDP